jgi:hypothetical protein
LRLRACSKRKGLDKAIYQIGQALSKATPEQATNLQNLLEESGGVRTTIPDLRDDHDVPDTGPLGHDENGFDDAENPLQLLARASDLRVPNQRPQEPAAVPDVRSTRNYFAPVRAKLDVGEDVDPIDLGLATLEEAEALFT